jgi:hypothetical protein
VSTPRVGTYASFESSLVSHQHLRLWPLTWHSYEARDILGNACIYHIIYIPGRDLHLAHPVPRPTDPDHEVVSPSNLVRVAKLRWFRWWSHLPADGATSDQSGPQVDLTIVIFSPVSVSTISETASNPSTGSMLTFDRGHPVKYPRPASLDLWRIRNSRSAGDHLPGQ